MVLLAGAAMAQVNRAKAVFHFPQASAVIDPEFDGNGKQIDVLDSIVADFNKVVDSDRYLLINSTSTPDEGNGTTSLALERAKAAHKIFDTKLRTLTSADAHAVYRESMTSWNDILNVVKYNRAVPSHDEVVEVIEQNVAKGYGHYTNAQVIQQLKAIDGGKAYQYIVENIFDEMRKAEVVVCYVSNFRLAPEPAPVVEETPAPVVVEETPAVVEDKPVVEEEVKPEVAEEAKPEVAEEVKPEVAEEVKPEVEEAQPEVEDATPEVEDATPVVEEEVKPVVEEQKPVVEVPEVSPEAQVVPVDTALQQKPLIESVLPKSTTPLQRSDSLLLGATNFWNNFAVKTNLLYDAALIPNIAVEASLSKHISVAADWMYAWWSKDKSHYYWRIYGGDVELRYWLSPRQGRKFTGHHIGVYGGILTYDFELGGKGYLAEKWSYMAGLSYGYSMPLSSRLNLDFELGVGYMGGEYYEYDYNDVANLYIWQQTKKRKWFGPTRAEISLVYLLGKPSPRR